MILAGHERFDFVVISRTIAPELRPLVEWRRAPAPQGPERLKWAVFYVTAGVALLRARADAVYVRSPMPMVPNRVDLASIIWCHAGFHEAAGGRPPGESRLTWRAARAFVLALERFTYDRRTRLAEVETASAKATVERHYPGLPVVALPLIYDTDRFRHDPAARRETRSDMGADETEVVALFVGRNWNTKGLDLAVAGLADAHRRGARALSLWVAGRDDADRLARIAARHGMKDHVKLVGARGDIERYYSGADLFVLPTLYEHGSRASHEAAACGLPLVVTATHGPAELIGDDEGGIVIERDPASIGSALVQLAADPALRQQRGRVARERMLEGTRGASAERYLELLEELANGSTG
jgi:glycosyltransferase involved in cell wall biosynthesis